MSILNSMLKVAGTIVEGAGRTLVDCVEAVEQENKKYKESDAYKKAQADRERIKADMKDNWNKFKANNKDYIKTFKTENNNDDDRRINF